MVYELFYQMEDILMQCRKCGAEINDDDLFCAHCGSRTQKAENSTDGYFQTEERTVICRYCGKRIPEKSVGCPYCGKIVGKEYARPATDSGLGKDSGAGWGILGFLFPLVGLVLYLVWKDNYPNRSSSAGAGAIVGTVVIVIITIISVIAIYATLGNLSNMLY